MCDHLNRIIVRFSVLLYIKDSTEGGEKCTDTILTD